MSTTESNPTEETESEVSKDELKEKQNDDTQSMSDLQSEKVVEDVCGNMLDKVMTYLQGELTVTCEDYKLLETLNNMTITKYEDMSNKTKEITENLETINEKYIALQPYLEKIDQLEEGVQKLEAAAYKLDAYSKQLELKFKKLDRK